MKHAQRGASMVEFAIVASLMLILAFGIMQCALLLYSYHATSSAARQASRWAMVRGADCLSSSCPATAASVKDYVLDNVPLLETKNVTVATTWSNTPDCPAPAQNGPGCTVKVTVSYPFTLAVPFITSSVLTLSSSSQMVISE